MKKRKRPPGPFSENPFHSLTPKEWNTLRAPTPSSLRRSAAWVGFLSDSGFGESWIIYDEFSLKSPLPHGAVQRILRDLSPIHINQPSDLSYGASFLLIIGQAKFFTYYDFDDLSLFIQWKIRIWIKAPDGTRAGSITRRNSLMSKQKEKEDAGPSPGLFLSVLKDFNILWTLVSNIISDHQPFVSRSCRTLDSGPP